MFICQICQKIFNSKYDLNRHKNRKTPCTLQENLKNDLAERRCYKCKKCEAVFSRQDTLNYHERICKNVVDVVNLNIVAPPSEPSLIVNNNHDQSLSSSSRNDTKNIHSYNNIHTTNSHHNNSHNNTVNVAINLAKPGKESIAHITKEKFLDTLEYPEKIAICKLFRMYYFDVRAPQNLSWCIRYPQQKFGAYSYNDDTDTVERWASKLIVDMRFCNFLCGMDPMISEFTDPEVFARLSKQQQKTLATLMGLFGVDISKDSPENYENLVMVAHNYRRMVFEQWKKMDISPFSE